jgi:uncharacterized protein YjbJ (UPF0337 family)
MLWMAWFIKNGYYELHAAKRLFIHFLKRQTMKTSLSLSTSWEEVKEKIKEANYHLTDEDLDFAPGQEEEMLQRVATKLGKDVDWVKSWIESVSFTKRVAS